MHLHCAAAICYDLAIQSLLSTDISLSCRDKVGETALHVGLVFGFGAESDCRARL